VGELLKASERQAGARGRKSGGTRGTKKEPQVDAPPTLADLGVTKKLSSLAQNLEKLPAKRALMVSRQVDRV
jgi:hypothetical protein